MSKAVFEKAVDDPAIGAVMALAHYKSTHKTLEILGEGGALFLVTVRPPEEQLWLVAVLENPARDSDGWLATNTTPITDITSTKTKLVFTSGTGISAKPGALGMSLQTPRALTDGDVAQLRAEVGREVAQVAQVAQASTAASHSCV